MKSQDDLLENDDVLMEELHAEKDESLYQHVFSKQLHYLGEDLDSNFVRIIKAVKVLQKHVKELEDRLDRLERRDRSYEELDCYLRKKR